MTDHTLPPDTDEVAVALHDGLADKADKMLLELRETRAERDRYFAMVVEVAPLLRAKAYASYVDGECEHGFWWDECTNDKCWLRDSRNLLKAAEEATRE